MSRIILRSHPAPPGSGRRRSGWAVRRFDSHVLSEVPSGSPRRGLVLVCSGRRARRRIPLHAHSTVAVQIAQDRSKWRALITAM